ncbi:hypothetical protein [Chakrabartyella piscis]|uniref:hypothetical protein n=1 Tax=Chakrabartyella piscis TaxID=2918914 RepID=UPI0029589D93|nr:hypothetical protein [Chakrabartyella piscis]
MELSFIKCNPTENMTILVETPVAEALQREIGEQLISYGSLFAEQAGFIQTPTNPKAAACLRMMGGEFCGNATLSLAAYILEQKNLPVGGVEMLSVEVIGTKELVNCQMTKLEKGFSGLVDMPLPLFVEKRTFSLKNTKYTFPVVGFEGISHVVVEKEVWGNNWKEMAESATKEWTDAMPEAFGVMIWDAKNKTLDPLVCVQGSSLVWEGGCGSGTSAVGAYLAMDKGESMSIECRQPGGVMGASVEVVDGCIAKVQMKGNVFVVAKGTVYL